MDAASTVQAPRADLFDPASLAALGRIEIVARWIVDGFLSGLHRSPRKGFSVEFAEYRPYQPGDDLRYIDWKIAARSDRWVVKQYEEETNLRASIVLDVSRSMDWSGARFRTSAAAPAPGAEDRLTKLQYAERLAAALALLLLRQRDAVSDVRAAYRKTVDEVIDEWRTMLGALGAGYDLVSTDEPFGVPLRRAFAARQRLP